MIPHTLDSYRNKYGSVSLDRTEDGVLTVRLHDPGRPDKSVEWGYPNNWNHPYVEWSHCFHDIARDLDNEVVILTGTGDQFISAKRFVELADEDGVAPTSLGARLVGQLPPVELEQWDWSMHNGVFLQLNMLAIDVPVIAAINGPALTHSELPLQSDIVICSDTTIFQDQPHFDAGTIAPGDGVALVWCELIGLNRGRYFLLTGQQIDAQEALRLGIVSEVLAPGQLMPRAHEIASKIMKRPRLERRYTRQIMVRSMRKKMLDHIGPGLALEGLSAAGRRLDSDPPITYPWRA